MSLAEYAQSLERIFQVHHEIGLPMDHVRSDGERIDAGGRDWSKSPCGEPYITLTSGGEKDPGTANAVLFAAESVAASWFKFALEDYAASVAPKNDWGTLHLYWRTQPEWNEAEFIARDQASLVGTEGALAADLYTTLGTVYSRLVISTKGPDGREAE